MCPAAKDKRYKIGSRCDLNESKLISFHFSRVYALLFFIVAVTLIIVSRLYLLQVMAYDSYKALAENQHSVFKDLIPKRGQIYLLDKGGLYPVAVNKDTKMAYAVPKEIKDSNEAARLVASVLGLDERMLKDRFNKPDDMYEVLKHKLSDEEIDKINELKLEGIHLIDESYRYYPAGELASNVLGFVGWKDQELGGRYGMELYLEDKLKGSSGSIFQKRDPSGRWISTEEKEIKLADDGDDIVLTIDHIIQYETEKMLKSAIEKYQADRGTIIVMESSTGKILSMASYPTFDPNDYANVSDMEAFRNIAVSDSYECGSIFKAVTIASAIDSGKINPDTRYVDTGAVTEAGYTIRNSDGKANGQQTMTQVLEKSLNTGAIYAEKLLGNRNFYDYVKRFGFGEPTGASVFGEAKGNISNLENFRSNIQFFTAAFGQGIVVTPIQMISAYNAIANGGVLLKPQIINKIVHSDGSSEEIQPEEVRRVITGRAAQLTTEMLRSVVTDGHGKRADVPGYLVGGKTGTAQVAKSGSKGYEEGKNIGSFIGFAPTDNPKYTILIRIDNPKDVEWAESSAAPTFGELMKFVLEYGGVEPTEKYTQKDLDVFNATHTLGENFIKKEEDNDKGDEK